MNIQNYGVWQYMQQTWISEYTEANYLENIKMWTWEFTIYEVRVLGMIGEKGNYYSFLKWTEGKETNWLGYILDGITYWECNRRGNKRKKQAKGRMTVIDNVKEGYSYNETEWSRDIRSDHRSWSCYKWNEQKSWYSWIPV